jgi:hypothetical protein
MIKQGIVIQGPTTYYKEIINKYKDLPNIVWSTWEDEPIENLNYISKYIPLVLNKKPNFSGYLNINLQNITTLNGISYLINQGVEEILKIRGDIIISNPNKLLSLLKGRKMSFLQMCKEGIRKDIYYELIYPHFSHDYPSDLIMYGESNILYEGFNFTVEEISPIPPESLIAYHILQKMNIEFKLNYDHLIKNQISFFMNDCFKNKIDIIWINAKHNKNITKTDIDKNIFDY